MSAATAPAMRLADCSGCMCLNVPHRPSPDADCIFCERAMLSCDEQALDTVRKAVAAWLGAHQVHPDDLLAVVRQEAAEVDVTPLLTWAEVRTRKAQLEAIAEAHFGRRGVAQP